MSIVKRVGKKRTTWGVMISVNNKSVWIGSFATHAEAKKAEAEAKAELTYDDSSVETCDEFANRWVVDFPRERNSTNRHNRQSVAKFAEDFKGKPLDAVSRKMARLWAKDNMARLASVRAMYFDAMNDGSAKANPFSNLKLPQSRGRADITPPSADELEVLCEAARSVHGQYGEQYASMITFAAYTGIRQGELSVLEWSDVDFDNDVVRISKTLSNDVEILKPKNGKVRTIVLPAEAKAALHRVPRKIGSNLIFTTPSDKRFGKSSFHYHWHPVRVKADMAAIAWHELRHFCATYMIDVLHLSPVLAAKQLGHTDGGKLLLQLYAHPDEDKQLEAIKHAFIKGQSQPIDLEQRRQSRIGK